jgi:hypothetical protein
MKFLTVLVDRKKLFQVYTLKDCEDEERRFLGEFEVV